MEYQALYRRYRPQRFGDVVGQQHVTETLAREVEESKVAHAYLFAGPRGTGKTTTARILAKALNCANRGADGEPCDACHSCLAVGTSSSMDVIELDAASHNKVEDVRDIRVSVSTVASVGGAKRVFILDEAHMLTKAAGNALLKTLEEPPDHVHFVLATTEPYKLLDTIRSRSQRFDFHPVGVEVLAEYLAKIAGAEGYTADPAALMSMARHAGGSVRDSLSLLEQVAALGSGTVEESGVRRALGLAGRDAYLSLSDSIARSDAASALTMVAELATDGVDLRMFIGDAIGFFRGVFLTRYAPNVQEIVDEPADVLGDWQRAADMLAPADILRAVDVLSEGLIKLREGREERLMLELALLRLTRPEVAGEEPAAMSSRIEKLEQKLNRMAGDVRLVAESASPAPAADTSPREPAAPSPAPAPAEEAPIPGPAEEVASPDTAPVAMEEEAKPAVSDAGPPPAAAGAPTEADLERIWPQLVAAVRNELGARREAVLREAMPGGVEGSVLVLVVPAHLDFHLEQLQSDTALGTFLSDRAGGLLGDSVRVEFRSSGSDGPSATVAPDPETDSGGEEHEEPEEIPDKDRLMEAPADNVDPLALLSEELGAEVIHED